ncbi:rhodanese-like domain-containing protein [Neobacillus sp. D3-1R]|uniref:rhodanese-like domain-containing protein n=1 Tax=Neobacillus sp. D3-1R TaxID=3445778 RepID=UPI003F9EBC4A
MTIRKISPKELAEKMLKEDNVQLLDVRAADKYQAFHIEGTNWNIPKNAIFDLDENLLAVLPKEKEIIVTCTTGNSATKCAEILAGKDYNVVVLEGGVTAWKEYKNPSKS